MINSDEDQDEFCSGSGITKINIGQLIVPVSIRQGEISERQLVARC